jgi:molybdopterin-guanine dinucleotide biosynthesis protein A
MYPVEGEAMGLRAARALRGAATMACWLQGGNREHATLSGFALHIGEREGSGPLGALIDALDACPCEILLTLPCDVPYVCADDLAMLRDGIGVDADAAVAVADDRRHWLVSAWRKSSREPLRCAFESGERAIHRAAVSLLITDVPMDARTLTNVNRRP